jgi:hypothetical protein
MEPWRDYGPTVVRIEVKGWIRISIKVMRIRNPIYTLPDTDLHLPGHALHIPALTYTFPTLIYNFPQTDKSSTL